MYTSGNGDPAGGIRQAEEIEAVPVRHPGRWVFALITLVLVAMLIHTLGFSNLSRGGQHQSRYQWNIVGSYFTTGPVLRGLVVTIELTALAMALGIFLGVLLAVMRLSPSPILSGASWLYIWFFRGTPVLVQLLFWYNISYLYPQIGLGIPFGPVLLHLNANTVVTPFAAAFAGLGLNEGAYMAEIVRAGILSVDLGQTEAAQSLGMTRVQTLRRIVLPQAMRVIVPVVGNETISMLKTSSLASVVTVAELTYAVQLDAARNYETIPMYVVASLWYLIVTSVLTFGQYYVERYFGRGFGKGSPPGFWDAMRRGLRIKRSGFPWSVDPKGAALGGKLGA